MHKSEKKENPMTAIISFCDEIKENKTIISLRVVLTGYIPFRVELVKMREEQHVLETCINFINPGICDG